MLWCSFFLPSYEKIMTLFMKTFLLWKPVFAISLVIALFLFLEMPPQKMTHSFLNEGTFYFFFFFWSVPSLCFRLCVYSWTKCTDSLLQLGPSAGTLGLLSKLSLVQPWKRLERMLLLLHNHEIFFYMGWNATLFLIHCLFCISSEGLYKLCE